MTRPPARRIHVIDTHTGGEPTRVVLAGGPDLGGGPLDRRRARFRREFDQFRSAIVCEPRGSDVIVGALLTEPAEPTSAAGVIFFNNVDCLNMCGHGTIGVVVALGHLGRIGAGRHVLETPVGQVAVAFDGEHAVTFDNVPSFRHAAGVTVEVPGYGSVTGDLAWGGNWFFLAGSPPAPIDLAHADQLTDFAWRIRQALERDRITGAGGAPIDHIELLGPPAAPENDARSFVLCPGRAYDRSPCGTGTSAKLACLVADGRFAPGDTWRQESIVGSVFSGAVRIDGNQIVPQITGTAYVTGEAILLLDPTDPFQWGLRA